MAGLTATLASLVGQKRGLSRLIEAASGGGPAAALTETTGFGANPGALRMFTHVPDGLQGGLPLVVVLHGCGQDAAAMDSGTGWSTLAERHGFAVLLPQQDRANNAGGCFNWFVPGDTAAGSGEVGSIAAMVRHLQAAGTIDARRVFVTGLSAGGAMANAMLATCPDLFAAGAIFAGLPYGAAGSMAEALDAMRGGRRRPDRGWGDLVRAAGPHRGPWPRVAVWQGLADTTVAPVNGSDIARQWLDVHGIPEPSRRAAPLAGAERFMWGTDAQLVAGRPAVELITLPRLGHGVPISAADADAARRCGRPGPYMLETGISSSYLAAQSWGLTERHRIVPERAAAAPPPAGPAGVVQQALRAAGLMRST